MLEDINTSSKFEISVNKKDMSMALAHVQSIIERRNIIPILSHVLIVAEGNSITLVSTDTDIIVSEKISASVEEAGEITISAVVLYDIVRKLDESDRITIKFDSEKSVATIISGSCKFSLSTLPAKDFPKADESDYEHNFSISTKNLKELIDKTKIAISSEETRYNLHGIYMLSVESMLRMVATDGHRLCIATSESIQDLPSFSGVIIPKKTVIEIRKIIEEYQDTLRVSLSKNKIKFSNNTFSLTSKLIDAKFPNYENLIPADNNIVVELSKAKFNTAVDRVSIIANEKFRGIKLTIENSSIVVSSHSENGWSANETLTMQTPHNDKFEIGFNFRYVLEALSVIKDENINISFKDPFSPVVITEKANTSFKCIIMPMRV